MLRGRVVVLPTEKLRNTPLEISIRGFSAMEVADQRKNTVSQLMEVTEECINRPAEPSEMTDNLELEENTEERT